MRCLQFLLTLLLLIFVVDTSAKIYICVDQQGKRHYSDKRCPKSPGKTVQSYTMTNKIVAPRNVTAYTPVLKLAKESLALMMILEPQDSTYAILYDDIMNAQQVHSKFLSKPNRHRFLGYNPMGMSLQSRLIASLSRACRQEGHMTICGAIEGNPWFSAQEYDFFKASRVPTGTAKFCDKATRAHVGGVITTKMRNTFCAQ